MITLNDYLYSGDTIFRILQQYTDALRKEARKSHNDIDMPHSKSGNFINIWQNSIRILLLLLKEGSNR